MIKTNTYIYPCEEAPASQLLSVNIGGEYFLWCPTVIGSEFFPGRPDWKRNSSRPHTHAVYHALLYVEGKSNFIYRDRWFEAREGTLVFTSPGESHLFGPQSREDAAYMHVSFCFRSGKSLPTANSYLSALSGMDVVLPEFPLTLSHQQTVTAVEAYQSVFAKLSGPIAPCWFDVQKSILDLFGFIMGEVCRLWDDETVLPLEKSRRYLERHWKERITIDELAEIACLSAGQFQRSFKHVYGDTPIHYQKLLRISAAKNLLQATSFSCKEIAHRTGFGDEYHFNKSFRQEEGLSPGAFRVQASGRK